MRCCFLGWRYPPCAWRVVFHAMYHPGWCCTLWCMDMRRVVVLVGGVLLGVGLVLGLMPVSVGGVGCGSGLFASSGGRVDDVYRSMVGLRDVGSASACADATSGRRAVALALGVPGALLVAGGWVSVTLARTDL